MTASFIPPKRVLMGPGPSDVSPEVLEALGRPTIGHLDPQFIDLMDDIKSLLQYAFQTENALTLAVSAPGSAGMETCFVNLVDKGDKVVIARNGVFGERMRQNVERCGGVAVMVDFDWGKAVDPAAVEAALKANPDAKFLAFVHAETSTGALTDAEALCKLAREHDCLTIVDAVTSLGGVPLKVDEWGIDAIYSGTQKCLSCVPGISPVSFSDKALAKMETLSGPVQSWFLDLTMVRNYWVNPAGGTGGKRAYHHTAPVNAMYALHESLRLLQNEGLESAWARHRSQHNALKAGLEALGLGFLPSEDERLPQLNAVTIPADVADEAAVRRRLLNDFNLEIGAGLGPLEGKVWRIGLMGASASTENVLYCIESLATVLADMGVGPGADAALDAVRATYS